MYYSGLSAAAEALLFGIEIVSMSESSVSSRCMPASIPPCFIRSMLRESVLRKTRTSFSTKVRLCPGLSGGSGSCGLLSSASI